MRRLLLSIVLCVVCTKVHGTEPFSPRIFENNSWAFVAGFAWPDENEKILIIRTDMKTTLLSLEELGITPLESEMTTAGFRWYQNSIGYVTSVKVKGMESESSLRVFYFRNMNGKESVVDLKTSKLIEPTTILNKEDLDKMTVSNAILLLKSDKPHDRQSAAIHLGQLGSSEHLQQLKRLLEDKAEYTQISGKEEMTVYYVKEAAEAAIRSIKSKDK